MKALRAEAGQVKIVEAAKPGVTGEAVVRVHRSGICNTDLEIVRGYSDFRGPVGHEFVGVVESSPEAPELVGKRVVGEINAGCGECPLCVAGDPRHCARRTVLGIVGRDGCHAEFVNLPAGNLLEVPPSVSDTEAVFAEPLAAAMGISDRVEIAADDRVAVIGDGKLGLLCAMAVRRKTENVVLIGRHSSKMAIAERSNVATVPEALAKDLSRGFDVVVEASGSPSGIASAVELVRPLGTIVLKSTFHGDPTWPASRIVVDEISVVGSRCGRLGPALDLLASGTLDLSPMVAGEFDLADGEAAFAEAAKKGVLKVLLRMDR